MRKYWSALIIILILPLVLAQDDVSRIQALLRIIFMGVDRALEQISLLLAANPESKAAKGLEIAQERLFEVKAMAEAKNLPLSKKHKSARGGSSQSQRKYSMVR